MFFLIGATVAGSLVLASADAVPNFDVEPSCRAAAEQAKTPDYVSHCRNAEQTARDALVQQWPQVTATEKTQCIPTATLGGKPTYTELLTCIELTRDVRRMQNGKPEPSTTGQGSK